MRRIITFLLVFLLASVASATTVTLVPIAEGDPGSATNPLLVSDTADILVKADPPGLFTLNAILSITGGTGSGEIIDATRSDDPIICTSYGWDPSLSFPVILEPGGQSVEIGLGNFMGNMNTIVAFFRLQCTGPGTVVVELTPGMSFGGSGDLTMMPPIIEGTLTIHQIPEPMTIALFGFGGLFLLRRRK